MYYETNLGGIMKKRYNKWIDLSLIIIFITMLTRRFLDIPDFIYGIGIGSSLTLSLVSLQEMKRMKKIIKSEE